jgi:putative hemolysin
MHRLPGASPVNVVAAGTSRSALKSATASIAVAQASEQLALPICCLPTPPSVESRLRESDGEITSALVPLKPFKVTLRVYIAMLQAAREATVHPADRYCLQIGYADIAAIIKKHWGVTVCKRSIQRAIDRLINLRYVHRSFAAQGRKFATGYVVLSCPTVMQMFLKAGCGHYRLLRGREIQLIRPIKEM